RDFDLINGIIYKEAKRRPRGALYLDTWYQFADTKTGRFAEYLPNRNGDLIKVRANDGVHFEPAGGDIIARLVLKALNQRYDLTSWKKNHAGCREPACPSWPCLGDSPCNRSVTPVFACSGR